MNLTQIIELLPPQVYLRRGELIIHFSTPGELLTRLAETSTALTDLERPADTKPDRVGKRGAARSNGASVGRSEIETDPGSLAE